MMIRIAGIIYLFIMCCILPVQPAHSETEAERGRAMGQQAGSQIKSEIGSTDQIQNRISNPLTSDGEPLQTFAPTYETTEQAVSFSGQLTAPSSNAFVEIFAQPAASGDLAGVYIRQDTDFDNSVDYVYNLSVQVSGVCANGIISCDAGTWNNCSYYKWTADDEAKVSLSPVDFIADLAACYCVNNHCGGNLVWNNMNIVLKDLGGGVVSAIHTRDPQYTITNVSTDGPVIKYYGQKTSEQGTNFSYQTTPPNQDADGVYLSGSLSPEQYYQGGMGTLPVDDQVAGQTGDANSYHSLLVDSFSAQSDVSTYICTISHNIFLNEISQQATDNGNTQVCMDHHLYGRIYEGENSIIDFQWVGTSPGGSYGWNCGPECSDWQNFGSVDTSTAFLPDSEITIFTFNAGIEDGGGCSAGSVTISNFSTSQIIATCGAGGAQQPTVHWTYDIQAVHVDPSFNAQNNCDPASGCRLKEEKVCDENQGNCVQTWQNFSPTGLAPFPYCKAIPAIGHTYTACMDGANATIYKDNDTNQILGSGDNIWWHIERVYECQSDNEYDLSDAIERSKHVTGSVQDNTTSMHYEDYNTDTGETPGYNVDLLDMGTYENCEKACKVRKPLPDTQAGVSGTTSDYRTTTASYVDEYRKCNNDVCPVAAGETILKNCACLNDFAEATSTMQVLSNAGKDMICSEN